MKMPRLTIVQREQLSKALYRLYDFVVDNNKAIFT